MYHYTLGRFSMTKDPNPDPDGELPLHSAVRNNEYESVKTLLNKGENIDSTNNDNETPLYYASMYNREEIGKVLISKKANVNFKNNKGWTPLHIAAWNGSKEMFEILILNGADINLKNNRGKTPLDYTTKSMIDSLNKETKEILDKTKKISELSKINNFFLLKKDLYKS